VKKQQGVALIVVILSSAVLLAVILTVVTSVSVSSRRTTGDQRVMTEAQYASESGLARVLSDMGSGTGDLRAWSGLLSSVRVPSVTTTQVMQLAAQFCNLNAISVDMNTALNTSNASINPVMLCETPEGQASPTYPAHVVNRFGIFSQYIPLTAVAPATQTPYQTYLTTKNFLVGGVIPTSQAQAETYWQRVFDSGQQDRYTSQLTSGSYSSQYRVRYGLIPVRVDVSGGGSIFSFVFRSSNATSVGEMLDAGGQVAGSRTTSLNLSGEFQVQIQPGSFAYYALLTNSQTISGGTSTRVQFTRTTLYDGPVHTNGQFTFNGTPWFSDTLSSSGCEPGYTLEVNNQPVCNGTLTPGAFTSATGTLVNGNPPNLDAAGTSYPQTVKQGTQNPTPGQYADYTYKGEFGKNIIPLPTNATQQKADAQTAGMYLSVNTSNPAVGDTAWLEGIEMAALDANGNTLNPDPAQRGTNLGAYQFFRVYRWERVSNCRAAPTDVNVNPTTATVYWNDAQGIKATVLPNTRSFTNAEADPNVTWSVGGGGGLSSLGPNNDTTYTAPGFDTTATVTARTQYGTNLTATASITVTAAPPPGPPAPPPPPPPAPNPPPPPPPPPGPPPSFTQHALSSSVTLAQAGCTYGGPVEYNWPVFDEYRSYQSGSQMILQKRTYPDDDTNIWTFPANKPDWNDGWSTVNSSFNGVLFVDGQHIPYVFGPKRVADAGICSGGSSTPDCSPPAVASFAKVNIVGSRSINIYGDLKYEKPLCYAGNGKQAYPQRDVNGQVITANCDDPGNPAVADNILGIYTAGQNSDINILGEGSFRDLTIHGVLMSADGRVRVAKSAGDTTSGADTACPNELQGTPPGTGLGSIRLLGGIIQDNYGVWGQFDGGGNITCGYGRSVTYDKRMANPVVKPPSFPTASGSTNWGVKIIRSDQPGTQINTNDPNNPASTVNAPLPVVKGTRQNNP
jgi:hypothetical protein